MSMNEKPEFTVANEFYWGYWAKNYIDNSVGQVDADFGKLQTVIDWAIGLTTISSFISAAFTDITDNPLILTLLCVPVPILVVARFFSTIGMKFEVDKFDPRVPSEIMGAYNDLMTRKLSNLKTAKFITLAAFIFLAVGLGTYYVMKNQIKNAEINSLNVELQPPKGKSDILGISGYVKDSTRIRLTIKEHLKVSGKDSVIENSFYVFNAPRKQFFTTVPVDCTAYLYSVNLEWPDSTTSSYLSMRLEIDEKGKIISSTSRKKEDKVAEPPIKNPLGAEKLKELEEASKRKK